MGITGLLVIDAVLLALTVGVAGVRWRKRGPLAGLVALTACVLLFAGWILSFRIDRVASVFYGHDTLFAEGFSEAAFEGLAIGEERVAVVRILGEPLRRYAFDGQESWCYTKAGPGSKNYWIRVICIDENSGRVRAKYASFYTN